MWSERPGQQEEAEAPCEDRESPAAQICGWVTLSFCVRAFVVLPSSSFVSVELGRLCVCV